MAVTEPIPRDLPPSGPLLRLVRDQRVAFLIVGGWNTGFAFALFVGLHLLLGNGFRNYMATLLISHVIGVLCAFTLHRRLVFRVRGHLWLDLARFEAVNLGMLGVNAVLLPFCVEVLGFGVLLAQAASTVVTVIISYLGHSLFSFRRPAHAPTVPSVADPSPDRGDS